VTLASWTATANIIADHCAYVQKYTRRARLLSALSVAIPNRRLAVAFWRNTQARTARRRVWRHPLANLPPGDATLGRFRPTTGQLAGAPHVAEPAEAAL
jgi:hypothetical protein